MLISQCTATASTPGDAFRRLVVPSHGIVPAVLRPAGKRIASPVKTAHAQRMRALSQGSGNHSSSEFELSNYWECRLLEVVRNKPDINIMYLALEDASDRVLPVYIGDLEGAQLENHLCNKHQPRPHTYETWLNSLEAVGYKATRACITTLTGLVFYARLHMSSRTRQESGPQEVQIDCRPSDAVNLALRSGAPIYVHRSVAAKQAIRRTIRPAVPETHSDIVASCRAELGAHPDPTLLYALQQQLAISEERYEDAQRLHADIERELSNNRVFSLLVAMESALQDRRYEEAAALRDELRALHSVQRMDL